MCVCKSLTHHWLINPSRQIPSPNHELSNSPHRQQLTCDRRRQSGPQSRETTQRLHGNLQRARAQVTRCLQLPPLNTHLLERRNKTFKTSMCARQRSTCHNSKMSPRDHLPPSSTRLRVGNPTAGESTQSGCFQQQCRPRRQLVTRSRGKNNR